MLMQRLTLDTKCGLNYDYMGYAEFEYGTTRTSRTNLATMLINNQLVRHSATLFDKFNMSTPVKVQCFSSVDVLSKLLNPKQEIIIKPYKTELRTESDRIVGWMSVMTPVPILIVRNAYVQQASQFIDMAVEFVKNNPI